MRISATGVLLSPVEDVWKLVGEPFRLPDWWPGYTGVQPDRRGLSEGARWTVVRGSTRAATSNLRRVTFEGLRPVPREAVSRLRALCQTAADL